MPKTLSLKGYALHRGCEPKAVRLALQKNRISGTRTSAGWEIDPIAADADWDRNTRIDKAKGKKLIPWPAEIPLDVGGYPASDEAVTKENSREVFNIAAARAKHFQAQLSEIELKEKTKELVSAAETRAATFTVMRQVRDALQNLPDRCASDIAAETDPFEVHRRLSAEIRTALTTLSKEIKAAGELARPPAPGVPENDTRGGTNKKAS